MARIIPNDKTWVGFATSIASTSAPTAAEIGAAVDLTQWVISITAQSQGNTVPTPTLDNTFETNIQGTVSATFTADFYRDDASSVPAKSASMANNYSGSNGDVAWNTLTRSTKGYFLVSRFGGTGGNASPGQGEKLEVWPVIITSRSASALASNTAQTFTVSAAVFDYPAEAATVAATNTVPLAPTNLAAAFEGGTSVVATGVLILDWDAPLASGTITGYKVYKSSNSNFSASSEITANITKTGTTARITTLGTSLGSTAGTWYLKVLATNSNGDGALSDAVSVTTT